MSRDSFNDSIIMNNMGGGSAPNIELDLEPQDVIDTEFVEQVPPKKSRKKLFLALALAGVVIGGVAALQFPQVHALLEGNNQKLDLAALSGVEGGSTTAGNPFAMPEASAPQQDVVAAQLPAAPAPSAVLPDAATPQPAVVEAATSAPQPAPVALEDAAEAELLAAAAGSEPVAAAPAPVQQVQQPQPAPQVVTETPVPAPVQAAVPAPAPDASPAPVSAQPVVAPVAPVAKVATPVAPASVKPAIETKKAPPAEPKKASAPAPRKNETAQRTKPAEPSSKEPETVRDVMVVTASQIGLRAFTDGQLVVSTGGRDAAYRVHDLLPSGERIERIDPVAMTVITDRSVIRVKP